MPLINYPSIQRYRPLQDGTHCLYYAPEPGGLSQAVLGALQDRTRLAVMAENARDHATRFHRREIIGKHIVDAFLFRDRIPISADRPGPIRAPHACDVRIGQGPVARKSGHARPAVRECARPYPTTAGADRRCECSARPAAAARRRR